MGSDPDWQRLSDDLTHSLPKPPRKRQLKLLQQILREWSTTDLREHLSGESRAIIHCRIKRLENIKENARQLSEGLKKIDDDEKAAILAQMIIAEGRRVEDVSRVEFEDRSSRLTDCHLFLVHLAAIAPKEFWKLGPGHPPNIPAYLVLQDAAAIFEWLTRKKATRVVGRIDNFESGPFLRFASILWPVVFKKDTDGLPAAMKKWARWRSKYDERSALIVNIALRHPEWGIFKR